MFGGEADFLAQDGKLAGGGDGDLDAVAGDFGYLDFDVGSKENGFADTSADD